MKQTWFWPRLIGLSLLAHVILIVLSIAEVFVYSLAVSPGKDEAFYQAHAEMSAPWVSIIAGAPLFFLMVRRYVRKWTTRQLTFALALPLVYIVIDIAIVFAMGGGMDSMGALFIVSKFVKVGACLLAYLFYKNR